MPAFATVGEPLRYRQIIRNTGQRPLAGMTLRVDAPPDPADLIVPASLVSVLGEVGDELGPCHWLADADHPSHRSVLSNAVPLFA